MKRQWEKWNDWVFVVIALLLAYCAAPIVMYFFPLDPPVGVSFIYDTIYATVVFFWGLGLTFFVIWISWRFIERFIDVDMVAAFNELDSYQKIKVSLFVFAMILFGWCLTVIGVFNSPGYVFQ